MSKYGEPLTYHKHGEFDAIARDDGLLIATVTDAQLFETDVRRIIACVNGLAGKNPDALGRFVLQAKMALEVMEAGPESMRVGARALRKAMEEFGA